MTGQPPEDPERMYSRQYEDPLTPTAQFSYGNYGEPRYRENPQQPEPTTPYEPAYDSSQYQEGQYPEEPQYQEQQAPFPAGPQFTPAAADDRSRYREGAQEAGAAGGSAQTPPPPGPPAPPGPARGRPPMGAGTPRGFLGSLFDFSFSSFVTPRIIKAMYALFVVAAAVTSLIFIVVAFRISVGFGIFTLLILAPIGFLLWVAFYRVILEFYMVTFRMAEDIRDLRDRDRESR